MEVFFSAGAGWRDACRICAGEYTGEPSIKTIVRYILAKEKRRTEEEAWRLYVSDALYALCRRDVTLSKRFKDILHPVKDEEPEAIIARIRAALGGDED